jgi:type III pantothenate kinase
MILALDIGNSNIKVGMFHDDVLQHRGLINTDKGGAGEKYEIEFKRVLAAYNVDYSQVTGVVISSVVPEVTNAVKDSLSFLGRKVILMNDINTKINLKITPEERKTRGTDILADIIAGVRKYKENFITIDFGTAIVVSAIGKDAEILGVSILPSAPIIINALSASCSQLIGFELKQGDRAIGKTTIDALNGGIFWLIVGGINEIVGKIKKEYGIAKVCFTGGMSRIFMEYANFDGDFEENLTLNGIYQFFKLNTE